MFIFENYERTDKKNMIAKKIYLQVKMAKKFGVKFLIYKLIRKIGLKSKISDKEYIYYFYKNQDNTSYKENLIFWYEIKTGKKIDIDHPKTYNEKIQWLKIYDNNKFKTILSDKYEARQWVKDQIGEKYLTKLYGVWENFDQINFDLLPNSFALKCTHGSGMNLIVKDKRNIDFFEAKRIFDKWMDTDFSILNFEPQYHDIKRRIIAEEFLSNSEDNLYDYKFWCNNGKCDFIMFLSDRNTELKMANFDRNWNLLPFVYDHEQYKGNIEKPDNLEEMINIAEKLSKGFYHVRVDLYRLNDGTIKFGEMTFTSMSGVQTWIPEESNYIVGKMLKLPVDN